MRFEFLQRWRAPADEVLEVYLDPAFWSGLDALRATAAPDVLGVDRGPDHAVVRLRYTLAVQLPREAARFIDPGEVTWIEETTWDLAQRTASVRFVPTQAAGLLRAGAQAALRPAPGGSTRRVTGDLRVRVPLVGGRVERAVVDGVGEHLAAEAEAVEHRLG